MTNTTNKTGKDDVTRVNTDVEARENARPPHPAPGEDNDPERTGGDIEARGSRPPAQPSPRDNDPDRGSS